MQQKVDARIEHGQAFQQKQTIKGTNLTFANKVSESIKNNDNILELYQK